MFGKLLLLLLAVSCLRVLCTYCLLVIGDISVFPVSLYRACTEHKITASACSLLTLVILDAAVTGGGGGIVLGVVVAIEVSKINSIIISYESINLM